MPRRRTLTTVLTLLLALGATGQEPLPKSIELGSGETAGSETARVAIIEFSDYQCPYCRRYHDQTFPSIKQQYLDTGKVRYEFRHLPLAFHAQARPAAVAASCAARLRVFWRAHDELFKNSGRLGPELYAELPRTLGVDASRFTACLVDRRVDAGVGDGLEAAERLGIGSTPSFLLGRVEGLRMVDAKVLAGAKPLERFQQELDALLAPR